MNPLSFEHQARHRRTPSIPHDKNSHWTKTTLVKLTSTLLVLPRLPVLQRCSIWWAALIYDLAIAFVAAVLDIFFRETSMRGLQNIPDDRPIIFAVGPHANQFVDPFMIMRAVRRARGRRVYFIANKTSHRWQMWAMSLYGIIPVRPRHVPEAMKDGQGTIYLPDPVGNPRLVRGIGTNFRSDMFTPGALLVLPKNGSKNATAQLANVVSENELLLRKPFDVDSALKQLARPVEGACSRSAANTKACAFQGSSFTVVPYVRQQDSFSTTSTVLTQNQCVGIFPEACSHEETNLLPLKAGVAIMALETCQMDPSCGVVIVPTGLTYSDPSRFRSRAVVEFGAPVHVEPQTIAQYKGGQRIEAIAKILDEVRIGLSSVTTQARSRETLSFVDILWELCCMKSHHDETQTTRATTSYRQLLASCERHESHPLMIAARKALLEYGERLRQSGFTGSDIDRTSTRCASCAPTSLFRLMLIAVHGAMALPGTLLAAPALYWSKHVAERQGALAVDQSFVKRTGVDVVATWKVCVGIRAFLALEVVYSVVVTHAMNCFGITHRLPPGLLRALVTLLAWALFPSLCYLALWSAERMTDHWALSRTAVVRLNPSRYRALKQLQKRRESLRRTVRKLTRELLPDKPLK